MSMLAKFIAGRLGLPLQPADAAAPQHKPRPWRLGIYPGDKPADQPAEATDAAPESAVPAHAVQTAELPAPPPEAPAPTVVPFRVYATPPASDERTRPERTKGTYRLPDTTIGRLRAYAKATRQYQYLVVAEALEGYLDHCVPALPVNQREHFENILSTNQADADTAQSDAPESTDGNEDDAPETPPGLGWPAPGDLMN